MNGNGARPDVWAADTEAPRARILELEREVARLAEANAAHVEAYALVDARLARALDRAETAEQQVAALEARLAVTVPMLPVETLYRSVPIDTRAEVEALPADALLRFSPPRALVPLEAHRQQGSDTVDPDAETAPSASAYRYVTPWQETHP